MISYDFRVLVLILMSWIHFEIICVYSGGQSGNYSLLFFCTWMPTVPFPFHEETMFLPLDAVSAFVVNQLTIDVRVCQSLNL